jgi:hypothetical protein
MGQAQGDVLKNDKFGGKDAGFVVHEPDPAKIFRKSRCPKRLQGENNTGIYTGGCKYHLYFLVTFSVVLHSLTNFARMC